MAGALSQGRGTARFLWLAMAISLCIWCRTALAVNYVVGDSSGWAIMNYDGWEEGKTFRVGDTLQFVYTTEHDVQEVTEANYDACTRGTNPVNTGGNTTYTLSSVGDKYFICTVGNHCSRGMKIDIDVEAAASSTTPPAPASNSTTPTTPSSTNTTSPPENSTPPFIAPSIATMSLILGLTLVFFRAS